MTDTESVDSIVTDTHDEEADSNHVVHVTSKEALALGGKSSDDDEEEELCSWEPYGTMTKKQFNRRVWRNIVLLSLAFMLNYISYGGLSSLQSSLHVQEGMAVCTLCFV